MVDNTGMSNGPSFTYNDKNQATAIGSNSYTYSGLGPSNQSDTSGTTYYTRCSCGLLVNERLPNGSKDYYLFDGLGSIVGLTNSSSSEVNAYDYDPYGVILNETTPQPNPFQYAGGYFESSTGLVKFGTRYYNPKLGRWTQQDPVGGSLGSPDSLNPYLYARDNPVNLTDPSGRDAIGCIVALVGSILGALGAIFAVVATASGWALTGAALVGAIFGFFGALIGLAAAATALVVTIVFACGVSPQQVIEIVAQLIFGLH